MVFSRAVRFLSFSRLCQPLRYPYNHSGACFATIAKHNNAPQGQVQSKRPQWLQAIFADKRTYFEDISQIEQCFLTNVQKDEGRKCFSFSFDEAPKAEHRHFDTAFGALRDTCRCEKCFDVDPQQRLHNIVNLDLADQPAQFHFDREQQLLHVTWASDGHKSVYSGPWLYATFTPHPLYVYPKKKLWTVAEYMKNFQTFDFVEICSKPESMYQCLLGIATYGLVKVVNAPAAVGAIEKLSHHMNYIKKTHYGEVFQVEHKPFVTNIAYAYGKLTQHIDLPYFEYIPGLQFLHCIRQSVVGGESTFADAFALAEYMRSHHKDVFEILTQTPIYAYNYTTDVSDAFLMQKLPPIILNPDGSIKRAVFSNLTFDSFRHMTANEQNKFLTAFLFYLRMLETPEYRLKFKLSAGEIAIFDNIRVTHGREAFDPTSSRLLEGCYMDWDEIYSRMRIIKSQTFRNKLAQRWPEK